MVENIKITARELKRLLKISIYLPENYNLTEKKYPVIYVLDGQMMFHSLDDEKKAFDLPEILDEAHLDCIYIGIHAPKNEDWRISELCPFYKKDETDIDPSLAKPFIEYISNILHPLLLERYRMASNVSILGFKEGAILSLYAAQHCPLFQNAGVFSPALSICEPFIESLDIPQEKNVYLFFGGSNDDSSEFYKLYTSLEKKCKVKLIYEELEDNSYASWMKHIVEFTKYTLTLITNKS